MFVSETGKVEERILTLSLPTTQNPNGKSSPTSFLQRYHPTSLMFSLMFSPEPREEVEYAPTPVIVDFGGNLKGVEDDKESKCIKIIAIQVLDHHTHFL